MKYVVTGSLGHISKPLAEKLIQAGHQVTIISSSADRAAEIEKLGATAAIGSIEDTAFLKQTFTGADAVYTMIPPTITAPDWKQYIANVGKIYAEAIQASGVKHVVNLSSIGAHMSEGCGPVSGLHFAEQALNNLQNVNVLHLRPGYFYYNFLANAGMVKHMGIIGGNYGPNTKMVLADTNDIAEVAAEALLNLNFAGKNIRYIVSDERTTKEIAAVFGEAIGKPDLQWIDFSDQDTLGAMVQNGLPEEIAKNYTEMGVALRNGEMAADYYQQKPVPLSKTKLEDFAPTFAQAYEQA
ncbi:NmrA family NAD(P)-binding protein [Adhaeribacter radiodurans]|uniref:NmrA family NAD(P)-binding protein n=1 Tax=Adhaeribacter radiodurans TaxID=2745197 RepID=A0A7L7L9N8_9BACT|nr:NmrA family NAD(P)-binding protein [Adhaeribacter radiodurans]QMU29538.1 NmrA family NAD(P)-binding protein [Adhaeribacter radiodurans]